MNNTLKKIVAIATVLTVSVWLIGPGVAQGVTAEDLQASIDALLAQLADLQEQLAELTGEAPTVAGCTITSFDRNLSQGSTGDDVNCLQIVLNSASDTQLASTGVGSSGNETSYFGPLTKGGVIKFQEKYADEVLASWGLTTGTGYVGTTTRAKLNELLVAPAEQEEEEEEEEEEEAVSGLTVALASDTPAAAQLALDANANFTKFVLTAGSEGSVSVSKIYVTRSGLSDNSDLEDIKIIDAETGVHMGTITSLNTDSRAMVSFIPSLVIPAGTAKAYYVRAGFHSTNAATGNTAFLGIASNDDIVSNATEVTGAPVTGNAMTAINIAIADVEVQQDGTVSDSTPDIGDTDVVVNKFKVSNSATEAVTIEQITVLEYGTAGLTDTSNIELYDVTNGESLGTAENWDAEGKAGWSNLSIVVDKGETHRFKVMLDVVKGAGLTVNADLTDGTDALLTAKGNTYGFYNTVDIETDWDGRGSSDQTIGSGALTVSKSASTPATGSVAVGSAMELAIFDFNTVGEEVRVSTMTVIIATTDNGGDSDFDYNDITNVKVYDEDGAIVAGPGDLDASDEVAFTDTFIVPVGTHEYTVKAKIGTDAYTGNLVQAKIKNPRSYFTAKGMTTNDSISGTSLSPNANVDGNVLTIAAGSLIVTNLTQPAARLVAVGTWDFVWMTASLSAAASGEDVEVTDITITDTVTPASSGGFDDIDNCELWADLTSESSDRGDIYETLVSLTKNPTDSEGAGDQAFALTQVITVSAGTFVKVAFVGDASTAATDGDTHTVDISAVTANGAETGTSITITDAVHITGSGQGMEIEDKGTLTISVDSSSPDTALVLDGTDKVVVGIFKLAANTVEDLDLDSIEIMNTENNDAVDTYWFYSNSRSDGVDTSTPIGYVVGGTTAAIYLNDGTVTVPADGYVLITVKADTNNIDGTYVMNTDKIEIGIEDAGDIDTTGLGSGEEVDSTQRAQYASEQSLYEGYPRVTCQTGTTSWGPTSGDLIPSTQMLLAVLDVTNPGTKDVTFDGEAAPDGGTENDKIYVQIANTEGGSGGADVDITLVADGSGNTLDDPADANPANLVIDFTTKDFVVSAGQTKQLVIYADTSSYTTNGDFIQLWLNDNGTAWVWSIDYDDGDYSEIDEIFGTSGGDIRCGAFIRETT